MKVYRIKPYIGNEFTYIENSYFKTEIVDSIIDGEEVDTIDSSKFIVKYKTKKLPDLLCASYFELFANQRLKDFLEELNLTQRIKFIPVTILKKPYFLINIIGLRDCMDYSNSVYTTYKLKDIPDKITSLVLLNEKIDTLDLFKLKDNPYELFITEELKKLFDEKGFTGIQYLDNMDLTFG